MYYVIRDSFPNGQIQIFSQQAYDNESQFVNKIIDKCDSLKEAQKLKQKLVDSEVNGYAGQDIVHGEPMRKQVESLIRGSW